MATPNGRYVMMIADLLNKAADPQRVIAFCDGAPMTLQRLRSDVAANIAALRAGKWRRGVLMTEDAYWALVGMLSLFGIGADVAMPRNLLPATLQGLINPETLVVTDAASEGRHCLVAGGGDATFDLPSTAACRIDLFTSGTSGDPVSAVKTLQQMEQEEAAEIEALFARHLTPGAAVLGTVTHQHLYGLAYRLFWPLLNNRPFHGRAYDFWEAIPPQAMAGSALVAGPAHLSRVAGMPRLAPDARPALLFSAGAPLAPAALPEIAAVFQAPLVEIYGSTETNTIAWR